MSDAIDVWFVRLDATYDQSRAAWSLLSPAERTRRDRFHAPRDAQRFADRRVALRRVLARYVGADPGALALVAGPTGKPALAGMPSLAFNQSSSSDASMIAVAAGPDPIGIDVERYQTLPDLDSVLRVAFTPADCAALAAGSDASRRTLRGWVRKEAVLKACGAGLQIDPRLVDGTAEPALDVRTVQIRADTARTAWSVETFEPDPNFVAAVASAAGRPIQRRHVRWGELA
ncbi:MAG: 4-phosphopantetheinyl transferase [Rhodospirillales bacterium]|jgi:4'-phosphopantetheinyl transferase|nr:4-phosphopantetheinyl transferase [Rhodospirillales bacterium]